MKKKAIIIFAALLFLTGCERLEFRKATDNLVTFKNEELNLKVDDLYIKMKDKYGVNALIDLIDETVLKDKYPKFEKEAKKEMEAELESVKSNFVGEDGKYNEEEFINALNQYYGITTVEDFKYMLELSIYRNKAIDEYLTTLVKDKDIEKYYEDEIFGDVKAKHILITPDVSEDADEKAKEKAEAKALKTAEKVIKKLNDGEDFDKLAKKYSDDESNAKEGGDLGYFNKGDMVPEFEEAAYELKKGKYTKTPVKTSFGYHVILKTNAKKKPKLSKVKDEIIETLVEEIKEQDMSSAIDALVEVRKDYGFKIKDKDLKKSYNKYISTQLINLRTQQQQQQQQ